MCRIAAFPPGFERRDALEILRSFAHGNPDGTGSAFVRDGRLVVHKWPFSFWRARSLALRHMPHDGWTLCHLRASTHGEVAARNTHPFVKNGWAVVHNGVWFDYDLVKAVLGKRVKWQGETDSEVAAYLFADLGPKEFARVVKTGGVFAGLNTAGQLWVAKTSGQLEILEHGDAYVLGSTLPSRKAERVPDGWLRFDAKGGLVAMAEDRPRAPFARSAWVDVKPAASATTPRFPVPLAADDDDEPDPDEEDAKALEAFLAAEAPERTRKLDDRW